ncbi:MAG: His/Gly/Thr/Pro-type tRNA ligase C-terminal domain-containing protein, partial [Alphaproteobacteria bacterium]
PDRFGIRYVRPDGTEGRPVMLHRAILGSIERFIAILIEHTAGDFPLWLAPEQVRVLSVTDRAAGHGEAVVRRLRAAGLRADLDARNEKLGFKIREAEVTKIPVVAVVGDKEASQDMVAPRWRGEGNRPAQAVGEFVAEVVARAAMPGAGTAAAGPVGVD